MTPTRRTGAFLLVGAAILWGTTGTAQEFTSGDASPASVGAARLAVGAAALLAVAGVRRRLWRPGRDEAVPLLAGAAAMAAYQPLFFSGVDRTGVAMGTIVAIGSAPVLAGALGHWLRGEEVDRRWVGATALGITGVTVLLGAGGDLGTDAAGVALALGAGAAYAAYAVAVKGLLETRPPTGVMAIVFGGAALLLSPILVLADAGWLASTSGVLVALHLGLIATAAAYVLFAAGLRLLPVAVAATLSLAEPLTAAVLGVAVVGERPSAVAWAGALLVLAALASLVAPHRRRPFPPRLRT